jgi:SNF2 family DNA or RNA helicase
MVQAEDRAHRVGQENKVLVQYLLAHNTADDDIWPLIQQKINLLEAVQISCESLDKVSKETNVTTASLGGRPEYPSITSYFKILDDKDEKDDELNW